MRKKIKYKHENGYTGVLYGRSSLAVYDADGHEVMHTGSRNINTLEELKELLDGYPEFRKMIEKMFDEKFGKE